MNIFSTPAKRDTSWEAEDIISLEATSSSPIADSITTIGEGASGGNGQEAWPWLVKDPSSVTGKSGAGDTGRLIQDGSLRSSDAAQSAADGVSGAMGMIMFTGRILVPGAPEVTAGSAIEIEGAPQESLNGPCMVRGVHHNFSKRAGFITEIFFGKMDGIG